MTTPNESIQKVVDQLSNLLQRKNAEYGNSALTAPVLKPDLAVTDAILVRMSDKIHRIENLAANCQGITFESWEDTLFDLAGYIVLYFAAKSEEKQ